MLLFHCRNYQPLLRIFSLHVRSVFSFSHLVVPVYPSRVNITDFFSRDFEEASFHKYTQFSKKFNKILF